MYICMHVCIHVCIYVIFKLGLSGTVQTKNKDMTIGRVCYFEVSDLTLIVLCFLFFTLTELFK